MPMMTIVAIAVMLIAIGLLGILISRQWQRRDHEKRTAQWEHTSNALRAQDYTVSASQFHGADLHLMRGGEIALAKIETRATPAAVRELAEVVNKSGQW